MDFQSTGKWLMGAGLLMAAVGLVLQVVPRVPWLGRLPGDIFIKKGNFSFYFPLATCLIVSLLVTILLRFFKK